MGNLIPVLCVIAALGCGLMAGFFFSFSFVVMEALGRLRPGHGIAAMQSVNVVVLNAWFFTAFFGTAALCVVVGGWSLLNLSLPGAILALCGSALYLAGVILVTVAFNVPLNHRLARSEPDSDEGEQVWAHYLDVWTRWNHVRTLAPLAAAALFIGALCWPLQG